MYSYTVDSGDLIINVDVGLTSASLSLIYKPDFENLAVSIEKSLLP